MEKLKAGFYTALGTPLDKDGNIIEESLRREIEMQIDAGASGLLLLGSMGIEESVKLSAWGEAARIAADAVNGRVSLFVGAMDNSVWRVKERLELLQGLNITGVVMTTPFYSTATDPELFRFFSAIADATEHPLYLYDLAVVTKVKINFPLVDKLIKAGKIAGIKTGDIVLARQLSYAYPDFEVLYSNIDAFDVALSFDGINKVLDGMFSCTPKNGKKFVEAYNAGDMKSAGVYLNNILKFRDCLLGYPGSALLYIFTIAMNLLGMEGIFCPDYKYDPKPELVEKVRAQLVEIGEL
ncbi:MAG: dihydrodipicolinate synthase family protein [Clostridia bacterium]|nr:dihydrodipicolinate synthase family protein [Clostridia bacterium]